jgi:hypothetical protein
VIHELFYFGNGLVAALDEKGNQLPEHTKNIFTEYLRQKLAEGVITPRTKILTSDRRKSTVADWI